MPDLAALLLRKSVGALDSGRAHCSQCRRIPLIGERLHETDSGRRYCDLCASSIPEGDRASATISVVHASERPMHVAPRARAA